MTATANRQPAARARRRRIGAAAAVAALLAAVALSMTVGSKTLPLPEVLAAVADPGHAEASIVWSLRIPRTLTGLAAGAALGACGALIQALTRNPLADPGILGVNAGAVFAVTLAIAYAGLTSPWQYVWFAIAGAFAATLAVYAIGAVDGARRPRSG